MLHIYHGILFSHKKEQNNAFAATWMDLRIVILSEVSQKEKDKHKYFLKSRENYRDGEGSVLPGVRGRDGITIKGWPEGVWVMMDGTLLYPDCGDSHTTLCRG